MSARRVPFVFIWISLALIGTAAPAAPITPDTIDYGNAVETANQALLAAQSALLDEQSTLQRDSFLHQQNVQLFQHQAIAEEEFRTSEWKVNHAHIAVELAQDRIQERTVEQEMAKLHFDFEQGVNVDIGQLAASNVRLWQARLDSARVDQRLKMTDRDYRQYEFNVTQHLQASNADSQANLALANRELQLATHNAELAEALTKQMEGALQRAKATQTSARHNAVNRLPRNESR